MRKAAAILIILIVMMGVGLAWRRSKVGESDKARVVASFYPLYFFAKEVVGDKMEVVNLTGPGVEPHDFEPSAGDVAKIEDSEVVLVNGVGVEPWSKDFGARTVIVGEELAINGDPHVWLDPVLAQQMVVKITEVIVRVDPKNESLYEGNSRVLRERLEELDGAFREGLAECRQQNFVTSHRAFGYLASRYGLNQVAIAGLSPEEEPSAQELVRVAKFAKDNGVRYVFFETLVSPRLAETVAAEVGVGTLVLDPIEGVAEGDYFTVQRENLKNLRIALECI